MVSARTRSWSAAGASARGSLHVRTGRPNQDSSQSSELDGDVLVLAVADGHGDARCIRAEIGARVAVASAVRVIGDDFANIDSITEETAGVIVAHWRAEVAAYHRSHPWEPRERPGQAGADTAMAYGTTLLLAVVGADQMWLLRIGDGDILLITETGAVTQPLLARADEIGGLTGSLASAEVLTRCSTTRLDLDASVRLVMLATDGYANSFSGPNWWIPLGRDYATMLGRHGFSWLADNLGGWVADSARTGGDDATVLLAGRVA